jgi:DNA recombination protein RmuC
MRMFDPVLLNGVMAVFVILMTVLLILVWRKVNLLTQSNAEQIKADLVHLLERNDETLKSGLHDSRKELRDVSAENRREINELFKSFQDTLLKRVVENSGEQNRQLNNFKDDLSNLSEKLIDNSNEFKQSVSEAFSTTSAALNQKQDEFREKTLERLNTFQEGIQANAKENRQELNTSLKSFEEKSAQSIKQLTDHLQTQFVGFNKQQDAFGEKTIARLNGFQESIQNDAKDNRKELNGALTSFESKFGDGIKDFNEQLRLKFGDLNKQQQDNALQSKAKLVLLKSRMLLKSS